VTTTITYWYLKPLDDNTNEQIAALLNNRGISSAESEVVSIEVNGTIVQDVYLVEYWVIQQLERSDIHHRRFRVYRKVGNGKIQPWLFQGSNRKKLAKTKRLKRVRKQLENLKRGK
jgi:hypothetical protein